MLCAHVESPPICQGNVTATPEHCFPLSGWKLTRFFSFSLHLTLPHMFSINIWTAQPWARKGCFPASLLWTNPGCSYNPALKNEHLGGSQMLYQCRAALSAVCLQGSFQLWGASARLLLDTCTHPGQTQLKCHQLGYSFQTTSSLQSPHSETSTPARARVVRYSSQKAESSCPLLLGVKKYRILKPTFTDSLLTDAEHLLFLLKMRDADHLVLTWKIQIFTYCLITTWPFKSFWLLDHMHKPRRESKYTHRTISVLSLK